MVNRNTLGSLIWLRIARFTHQSNLLSNEFLKPFHISVAQFDVLNQIASYQPITQSDLANKVTVSAGGISRMLSRLEQEGYIRRRQEWKTKWITLTEKGKTKMVEVFDKQLAFQTSLFDESLTPDEQKTLFKLMSKLQKHVERKMAKE